MKILYVANHGQLTSSNDDEGAIAYSLRQLGHEVIEAPEKYLSRALTHRADLLLFHKLPTNRAAMFLKAVQVKQMPSVFWYFDLVDSGAENECLRWRTNERKTWMREVLPLCSLGFCTDGDWVLNAEPAQHRHKLHWLTQGADPRGIRPEGPLRPPQGIELDPSTDLLWVGGVNGYPQRLTLMNELAGRYGTRFRVIGHDARSRIYGPRLAEYVVGSKIVIAPDSPVTDRYWSNRIYNMLAMGAFLIHPLCERLMNQYMYDDDLVGYDSREELHAKIDHYLQNPQERDLIAASGYLTTRSTHTYLHRCEEMLNIVEKELGVK